MREMFYSNVLLRLINNDRVIGLFLDSYEDDVTVLYSPMRVIENSDSLSFVPYDNLSDTPFAIINNYHIITTNLPSPRVNTLYEDNKIFFYPNIEDLSDDVKKQYEMILGESIYDFNKIKNMFQEFLNESKSN